MNRRKSIRAPATPPGHLKRFGAHILDDPRHDPYQPAGKYAEPTRCGTCGAVYHRGRWQWIQAPEHSRARPCPACRRVHDRLPAGRLVLSGAYVPLHRAELLQIVRNQAENERLTHPLNRVIDIDERPDGVEISTTDIHLPRRIGEALKHAHDGELRIEFGKDAYEIRVHWQR
jgi:hypothetical protein